MIPGRRYLLRLLGPSAVDAVEVVVPDATPLLRETAEPADVLANVARKRTPKAADRSAA